MEMNMSSKAQLQAEVKSTGMAYLLFFLLFGTHYAYQGKWGLQIAFWLTFGGLGIWSLIDMFRIPGMIKKYNATIFDKIDVIEREEKEESRSHQMAMVAAAKA